MQESTDHERRWLDTMRRAWTTVYVGIDHHSRQFTVAAAGGGEFQQHQTDRDARWMKTTVFAQDGLGYADFIEWLAQNFPDHPREHFVFVSEPTFSKPLCVFLAAIGFGADQVRWVKTTEVSPYRKAKGIGRAGKNDLDDARALATMGFEHAAAPHERRVLYPAAPYSPIAEGLKHLAMDYQRTTQLSTALKSRITELVGRLFPECRRVWSRAVKTRKQDGTFFEQRFICLFKGELPMRILAEYPTARGIAEAGFEVLWAKFGGTGHKRQTFLELVALAERSGGTENPLDAKRLGMLIEEYRQTQERLRAYREAMQEALDADPVTRSLGEIPYLGAPTLAAIVGALGDVTRFDDFDAVKRHLNIAPVPMPQTGEVDEQGRPVQRWRLPANSYKQVHGQRQLVYARPGLKAVREATYGWFEILVKSIRTISDDPFARLYQRMKTQHQGKPRWFGKVRWKVVAKLVGVIYHCLRHRVPYDPHRVLGPSPALMAMTT